MYEIYELLDAVEDPRQQKKVKHKLSDILLLVILGTLVEADNWVEIEEFGKLYEPYLKPYLSLENGIPSHDTIQRVMSMIHPNVTANLQMKWLELTEKGETEKLHKIVHIDGKTIRGNRGEKQKPVHVVSAYCHEDGICFAQSAVDEKSNEITAIPKVLSQFNVKKCIVTIDAMGTQTAIAEKIITGRGDYVLAVKENQLGLYQEIADYLDDVFFQKEIKHQKGYFRTLEKAHGQVETREYFQTQIIGWMEEKPKWKGLRSIGMVRKTIEKHGKKKVETRYYISSLETNPELFARCVRNHWTIESLHWHLDMSFGEDANQTQNKTAVLNHNNIRKLALAILKQLEMRKKKMSIRLKRFSLTIQLIRYLDQLFTV